MVLSHLPLLEPLETVVSTGVSLNRQLATVKQHRDASRRDLALATAKLQKVTDENDELHSFLAALCDDFQMLRPSLMGLTSQPDSVFNQLPPMADVKDEAS